MKRIIFLLAVNTTFSLALSSSFAAEYNCEGEDQEHYFLATASFEDQIMTLDMLQATQHTEGPFPLLPLHYKLNNLSPLIERGHRVYKFAPGNYQDCDYRWLWPIDLSSAEELSTQLKLNCDGVRSNVELICEKL